jgi:hypothetical protein
VVKVLGYRSGGPGSIPALPEKKVVDLERGPLSFVTTTEELLDRKVAASVKKIDNTAVRIRHADHVAPSIRNSLRTQTMEFSLILILYIILQFQSIPNSYSSI